MILHVLDTLVQLPLERIVVVVGHGAEHVTKTVHEQLATEVPLEFVEQRVQRGTGDAASVGLTPFADAVDTEDDVFVVPGDTPLLTPDTLAALATEHRLADAAATLLTVDLDDPTGYGRIVRDERGAVDRIVEQTDASDAEREITEINPSIYCFRRTLPRARAAAPQPRERAGRVLPDRRHRGAPAHRAPDRGGPGRRRVRDDGRQRPGAARTRRAAAAGPHQRPVDARGRVDDRSRAHVRRRERRARARRAPAAERDARRAARSSAPARWSGPTAGSSTRSSARTW